MPLRPARDVREDAVEETPAPLMTSTGAPPHTDSLVERARAGDDEAFAALFRAHWGELRAFVWRMIRDRAVAEEIVQDVFLRLCERAGPDASRVVSRAYLYAAARNRALNYMEHRRFSNVWTEDGAPVDEVTGGTTPAEVTQSRDLAEAARSAINALPSRCRQVYILRRDHGLGHDEIAQALGISPRTVENHLAHALQALRAALAAYTGAMLFVAVHGAFLAAR